MKTVTLVDYGMGNIYSVSHALEHCGAKVALTAKPEEILAAERLIIPGVGAFADGMAALNQHELVPVIREFANTGRPVLGICLGMQMLFDESDEFGSHQGLGLISGKVSSIPASTASGAPHKIPHIGWNQLVRPAGAGEWKGSVLEGIDAEDAFYFVHSFAALPTRAGDRLADCDYGGRAISASVRSGNVSGCQFHPEKSGNSGLRIIRNFLSH